MSGISSFDLARTHFGSVDLAKVACIPSINMRRIFQVCWIASEGNLLEA
jgi:hypothetical protein